MQMIEAYFNTRFETETTSEQQIGRRIFRTIRSPHPAILDAYKFISSYIDDSTALAIGRKFTQNSMVSYATTLGIARPASAYFSILDRKLYVEWGQVDPKSGMAKLHDTMRHDPKYQKRRLAGAKTYSGHIGSIFLPNCPGIEVTAATIESASIDRQLTKNDPEYNIAVTLLTNGVLPLSSDGYPLKLSP